MKNIKILLMVFLLGSVFALFGCGADVSPIEDTTWVLESFFYSAHDDFHYVMEDAGITALFDSTEGQVTGSAGCNNYFASYEIKKSEITIIGPIGATDKYCGPVVMDQEWEYLSLLETIDTFYFYDSKLAFTSSGNPVMVFVAE